MYPIWDLWQRVIHWCFPVLLGLAWWTAETDRMQWHAYCGYCVLVLVIWRFVWGFVGSERARFTQFLVGWRTVWAYLKAGRPATVGHNPLGAWSVMLMLVLLLLQAVSGLVNTDELFLQGPLVVFADDAMVEWASQVHELSWHALQALVGLHIAVVSYHQWVKKDALITQMGFGRRLRQVPTSRPRLGLGLGLLLLIACGVIAVGLVLPEPDPLWVY